MDLGTSFYDTMLSLDYGKTRTKISVVFFTFVFNVLLFIVCSVISSFIMAYQRLRNKDKVIWNSCVIRALNASVFTGVGIWAVTSDVTLYKDPVNGRCQTSDVVLPYAVGFFFFEFCTTMASNILRKQISYMLTIHHFITFLTELFISFTGVGHFFGVHALSLEMCLPFGSVCWILRKAGKSRSRFWLFFQFLYVHTFHVRSVVELYLWYVTYQNASYIWATMPGVIFFPVYVVLTLFTFLMTPTWAYQEAEIMVNNWEGKGKTN